MKALMLWVTVLAMFVISASNGSSNISNDVKVVQQAMQLDSMLEAEYNSRLAIKQAIEMDSKELALYTIDDVLEAYYKDPQFVKRAIFDMKRTKRVKLLSALIDELSRQYDVNSYTIKAIVKQESHYNPKALSPAGAIGLMQLMPGTAKMMRVADITHPIDNIIGGIKYVKFLSKTFHMKTSLVLAAYNAGPEAVKKYRGVPPYPETREYVKKVIKYRKAYKNGTV